MQGWPTFRLRSAQAPCILQPVGNRLAHAPRPLLGLFTSTALSPHAPTADPANNAHYSRFWDKWGASQNFVSSPLLALISPNLLILFTK